MDLIGKQVGELVVVEYLGTRRNSSGKTVGYWKCLCSCGEYCEYKTKQLTKVEVKSCNGPVHKSEQALAVWDKRGRQKRDHKKEYASWANAKQRVTNPNYPYYESYKALGMQEEWLNSFMPFYEHIGPCPEGDYSLDRIDNTKGYYEGNVQWATKAQQSQNVSKRKDNKSGVTGVVDTPLENKFVAIWRFNGKRYSKSFNYSFKYTYEEAFRLACEYRANVIKHLNEIGESYSDTHGVTTNTPQQDG